MTAWLEPSLIAALVSTILLFWAFLYLYFAERKRELLLWSVSWAFYALRFVFQLLIIETGRHPGLFIGNQLCAFFSGLLLLAGNYVFIGRQIPRSLYLLSGIMAVWIGFAPFLKLPFWAQTAPAFFALGLVYIQTGLLLLRDRRRGRGTAVFVGAVFVLWGIHKMDYPFLYTVGWFAPVGFMLGAVFQFAVSVGMILLYFQMARRDLLKAQQELQLSEQRYRLLVDTGPTGIMIVDGDGRIVFSNARGEEILGLVPGSWREMRFDDGLWDIRDFDGNPFPKEALPFFRVRHGESRVMGCRMAVQRGDGSTAWLSVNAAPFAGRVEEGGLIVMFEDVSKLREREDALITAVAERETLLREIHHRVKNNLQVVSSLLSLQMDRFPSPEVCEALQNSQRRVRAMGLVHEKLYRSGLLSKIRMRDYLESLTAEIMRTFPEKQIGINIEAEDVELDIVHSVPCGLLVNELVTNAVQHAFPDDSSGTVTVSYDRVEGSTAFCLKIADDGTGLPETVDVANPESMGLTLVQALSRQLNGVLQVNCLNGTVFSLTFEVADD